MTNTIIGYTYVLVEYFVDTCPTLFSYKVSSSMCCSRLLISSPFLENDVLALGIHVGYFFKKFKIQNFGFKKY